MNDRTDAITLAWARARARYHGRRELHYLELAVRARSDDEASTLEAQAYEAYQDAIAIRQEHELDC